MQFGIKPINPNPFTGNTLNIDYSVGFDASTTIEIYNLSGSLVKNVYNGLQKKGEYTTNVNISDLSSGSYTIIMKCGPYEKTQSLILTK
jgi:hypothetical protein